MRRGEGVAWLALDSALGETEDTVSDEMRHEKGQNRDREVYGRDAAGVEAECG